MTKRYFDLSKEAVDFDLAFDVASLENCGIN